MTVSNNTHSAHRQKQKMRVFSIVSVVFTLLAASFTAATEAFCPGGSSAQTNILFCRDFETATESYPADAYFAREIIGDAAVGNGAIALRGYPGGPSNGYGGASWTPSDAINTRYYFKFKDGYLLPVGENVNHGPGIQYSGVCQVNFRPDWTMTTPPNLEFFTTCGGTGEYVRLVTNRANVTLRNNRWYLAEVQTIMNTPGQNNGIARFWVDEQLVLEYTNLFIRDTTNVQFNQGLIYNSYTHRGNPAWPQKMLFDNFVVSNGTYIGPAVEENSRGTADPLSPYALYTTYEGFHGQRPGDDCFAVPGSLTGRGFEQLWRTGTNTHCKAQ